MRTRRSWRNQERLWRILGQPAVTRAVPKPAPPSRRCFDCRHYPQVGRSRGHCALLGAIVNGVSRDRACWVPRALIHRG